MRGQVAEMEERTIYKSDKIVITLAEMEDTEARRLLHEKIKAFNDANSPHHRAVRATGATPLDVWVRDLQGRVIGGLTADTYWGWLDIDDFWLAEPLRGHGLGTQMIAAVEKEAVRRGCRQAQVKTFSFQAQHFYEKCGYRVVGMLENYPPGATLYWLRKDFSATT